jgi:hypothetical protein
MQLLRCRVPIDKSPLSRRQQGAHNTGGEGGLCTEAQKSATSEARSDRGGSIVAAGIVVGPGGERTEAGRVSAAVIGDSSLRGEAGGARGRGRSAGAT